MICSLHPSGPDHATFIVGRSRALQGSPGRALDSDVAPAAGYRAARSPSLDRPCRSVLPLWPSTDLLGLLIHSMEMAPLKSPEARILIHGIADRASRSMELSRPRRRPVLLDEAGPSGRAVDCSWRARPSRTPRRHGLCLGRGQGFGRPRPYLAFARMFVEQGAVELLAGLLRPDTRR